MNQYLVVALGGAMGSLLRYGTARACLVFGWEGWVGTVLVNALGSFLIGLGMAYFEGHTHLSSEIRLFCITGFLGGLTTFSTYIGDSYGFWQHGHMLDTFLYAGGQVLLGLVLCAFGFYMGKPL